MQLHTILKFGLFVVLLDQLKIFQNLFVQKFDIVFMVNQNYVSVVDTFAVTNNHLVG